jgi:hypothetical protein
VRRFRGSNHIDIIREPRPRGARSCARLEGRPRAAACVAILRESAVRTAPQDEVHGLRFQPVADDVAANGRHRVAKGLIKEAAAGSAEV